MICLHSHESALEKAKINDNACMFSIGEKIIAFLLIDWHQSGGPSNPKFFAFIYSWVLRHWGNLLPITLVLIPLLSLLSPGRLCVYREPKAQRSLLHL